MECASVAFSGHALRRMFERELGREAVLDVIRDGEMIADYPDDSPYPSRLLLGFVGDKPVHVVVAREPRQAHCFVVTAYRPDSGVWQPDFKHRR